MLLQDVTKMVRRRGSLKKQRSFVQEQANPPRGTGRFWTQSPLIRKGERKEKSPASSHSATSRKMPSLRKKKRLGSRDAPAFQRSDVGLGRARAGGSNQVQLSRVSRATPRAGVRACVRAGERGLLCESKARAGMKRRPPEAGGREAVVKAPAISKPAAPLVSF